MTPVYDWTRFDALRDKLRAEFAGDRALAHARLRGKLADAREALERGQAVRMTRRHSCDTVYGPASARTPDEFCDLWEAGYRP